MDLYVLKKLALGMATYVPGVLPLRRRILFNINKKTGAFSARYCYAVWLRHLVAIHEAGLKPALETVAELGPGGSLGVGIAAMLTGAKRYWAFDVQKDCDIQHNLEVLGQLLELFQKRTPIPDEDEFPYINPKLKCYAFPAHLVTEQQLADALAPARTAALRECIVSIESNGRNSGVEMRYMVPWEDVAVVREQTVDLLFSQAVMEHVENLDQVYLATFSWLKKGGIASHAIDFKSHLTARLWNGHWAYSRLVWKLMKGRKPFIINRKPLSQHLRCMERAGFRTVNIVTCANNSGISRKQLAGEFARMSDEDLTTSEAYVIAMRP